MAPRTQPRRRLSAAERRELIERAAIELFAEHGYRGASIDAIVKRAGVTPPVFYDHFDSKEALHRALLERHYAELRALWETHLAGEEPPNVRFHRAFDAWFAYVEERPFTSRMMFRSQTDDPGAEHRSREAMARSRADALHLVSDEEGGERIAGSAPVELELTFEIFRVTLQGIALWWLEHPEVERATIVGAALNALWLGFERVSAGETFSV